MSTDYWYDILTILVQIFYFTFRQLDLRPLFSVNEEEKYFFGFFRMEKYSIVTGISLNSVALIEIPLQII